MVFLLENTKKNIYKFQQKYYKIDYIVKKTINETLILGMKI